MFISRVIKALEDHHVAYALVGGHAVALHGAVRGTVDLDIVVKINKKAYIATEQAMNSIGLRSRLPVSAQDVYEFREEYIRNKNLIAWSFVNPDKLTEIVDVIITEDLTEMKTVNKKMMGKNIRVVSIQDLIAMKKKANRAQDIEDIKALEKLR